MAEEKVRKCS